MYILFLRLSKCYSPSLCWFLSHNKLDPQVRLISSQSSTNVNIIRRQVHRTCHRLKLCIRNNIFFSSNFNLHFTKKCLTPEPQPGWNAIIIFFPSLSFVPLCSLMPFLLPTVHALNILTQQLYLVWPQAGNSYLLTKEFIHHLLGQAKCVHITGEGTAIQKRFSANNSEKGVIQYWHILRTVLLLVKNRYTKCMYTASFMLFYGNRCTECYKIKSYSSTLMALAYPSWPNVMFSW